MKGSVRTTLAGGACAGVTLTVLNTGSLGGSTVLAKNKASSLLNLSAHFLSMSSSLVSVDELEGLDSVEVVAGRLDDCLTDFSDLVDLECLGSVFFFFSTGSLDAEAPGVLCLSTTPKTETKAGSTRVGLSESFTGVDLASFFSFFNL